MNRKILSVRDNPRLLGPIMFLLEPTFISYSGMNLKEVKRRVHKHTGRFGAARKIQTLMFSFSRENVDLAKSEEDFCNEIFYFELDPHSRGVMKVYACSFPIIFPDEDVEIYREYEIIL